MTEIIQNLFSDGIMFIANTNIINESAPEPRFRVRIRLNLVYAQDINIHSFLPASVTNENDS